MNVPPHEPSATADVGAAATGSAATEPSSSAAPAPSTVESSRRLDSLDVFRGLTIAAMLIVNNPGSWAHVYPPLLHAPWHGWTPTDLIFPFFLFIVGVSLVFSFDARKARGATDGELLVKAAKRAAILFGLGLLLHGFPGYDLTTIRIPGVLQRIALAYIVAVPFVLRLHWRALAGASATLLLGYWALLTLVPHPGGGAFTLEPGGDLGAWLDRAVFGEAHLWSQSQTWDPEGLLSTLPAVATVLTGALAGRWLRSARQASTKGLGLLAAGIAGLVIGLAWDALFPINKNLWTSSYVVFTSGFACVLLAACYWTIDVRGWSRWSLPFRVYGRNAIAAFFLSSLFARVLNIVRVPAPDGSAVALKTWLWSEVFSPLGPLRAASLAFALAYVTFWLGCMAVLYRQRIFIKV